MKLLVLSHRVPYPPNKGEKIRTFHQLKALVEDGHRVSVYAPETGPEDATHGRELGKALNIDVTTFPVAPKAWRYLRALVTGRSMSEAFFYSGTLQRQFNHSLTNVDAVFCTASSMGSYIFSHSDSDKPAPPRLFMDFMDVDSEKWAQYANSAGFPMSWVYRRESNKIQALEQKAAQHFDKVYLIAQAEVSLFRNTVADTNNVEVLGNGLDTEQFYPAPSRDFNTTAPTYLFTGVMNYKPNEDAVAWFVTQCWPIIRQYQPDARFVIAGMNPTQNVQDLKQYPGVSVTGFVEDILACFHQADVFVAPFRLARGVQNKVLQAFACALPVVSTSMGAEGIDCQPDVHLKIADNVETFAQHCLSMVSNPEQSQELGDNALALIRSQYSWEGQLAPLLKELTHHD